MRQHGVTYDNAMLLKDAGLVAASAAGTVSAVAKVIDLGTGRFDGTLVVDVTACEVATGDERYAICAQGGDASGFGGAFNALATLLLGDSSKNGGSTDTPATGRFELPFTNEYNGVIYRYLRVYTIVEGTVATGINFTAFAAKTMAN